jgi:hypothetical protein
MFRVALVATVMVVPGGLLLLVAWVFAHALAAQMKADRDPNRNHRLARAFATVRLRDVVSQARHLV